MSVRKTVGLNQPDSSHVKAIQARFDRFGRGFSGESAIPAGARTHARGPVRFGGYTELMTNMPLPKNTISTAPGPRGGCAVTRTLCCTPTAAVLSA